MFWATLSACVKPVHHDTCQGHTLNGEKLVCMCHHVPETEAAFHTRTFQRFFTPEQSERSIPSRGPFRRHRCSNLAPVCWHCRRALRLCLPETFDAMRATTNSFNCTRSRTRTCLRHWIPTQTWCELVLQIQTSPPRKAPMSKTPVQLALGTDRPDVAFCWWW